MMRNTTEYNRVHKWVQYNLKPTARGECFYCKKKCKTEWSNIDHRYRRNPSEWQEVCRKCHFAYDKIQLGIKFGRASQTAKINLIVKRLTKQLEAERTPKFDFYFHK